MIWVGIWTLLFRGWSSTLAKRVRVVLARLLVVFALPLHFHGRLCVLRSMFIPGALHGIEASFLAESSVRKLRAAFCKVSWSSRQPLGSCGCRAQFVRWSCWL